MISWTIILTIACGVAVIQSLFLGGYLFSKNRRIASPLFFLSLILIGLALRIGKSFFYFVFVNHDIIGKVLGASGLWTVGPSFLLFTLASKPSKVTLSDLIHYLPSLLVLVFGWTIEANLGMVYRMGAYILVGYFIISIYIHRSEDWQGNKKQYLLVASSLGVIGSCFVLQAVASNIEMYTMGSIISLVVLYTFNFLILKDKSYFKSPPSASKNVDPKQSSRIVSALEEIFVHNKMYRQKGLTLATVAEIISFPSYQVSKTINQHYGIKFNEFVNQYRIEDVKTRLQDPEANDKIEVIAKEVGFSSTTSLYIAFKKNTKLTPQAYRKQVRMNL